MSDFLKKMAIKSMARAKYLPEKYQSKKYDLPSFDIRFSDFDIIAEYKMNSPAEGLLAKPNIDRVDRVLSYAHGGAAAISVLTEPSRFDGSLLHLKEIASTVSNLSLPVMRKDFLVDRRQILESKVFGASGILLIAALFDASKLRSMLDCAFAHSLFVLLESFNEEDVIKSNSLLKESRYQTLAEQKKLLFGVNTRNLKTLEVDVNRLKMLGKELPYGLISVAESGLYNIEDILTAKNNGYSMALIGTALMRSKRPEKLIRELLQSARKKEFS